MVATTSNKSSRKRHHGKRMSSLTRKERLPYLLVLALCAIVLPWYNNNNNTIGYYGGVPEGEQLLRGDYQQESTATSNSYDPSAVARPKKSRNAGRAGMREVTPDGQPSHVHLCRLALDRRKGAFDGGAAASLASGAHDEHVVIVLEESSSVCFDAHSPTSSMAQMLASTFVSEQLKSVGIEDVTYEHGCGGDRDGGGKGGAVDGKTVQQRMPSPLILPTAAQMASATTPDDVYNMCEALLQNPSPSPWSLLLSSSEPWSTALAEDQRRRPRRASVLDSMLPVLQTNLQAALRPPNGKKGSSSSSLLKTLFGGSGSDAEDALSIQPNTATIQISCQTEPCADAIVAPHYVYAARLPRSIHTIHVSVSPHCIEFVPMCKEYGEDLTSVLTNLFPRAQVNMVVELPSSVVVMKRLMTSEIVICGPSWTMEGLFPALTRGVHPDEGSAIGEGVRTVISPDRVLFVSDSHRNNGATEPQATMRLSLPTIISACPSLQTGNVILKLGEVPSSPPPLASLTNSQLNPQNPLMSFLHMPPTPTHRKDDGNCRALRGQFGRWIKDMDFAPMAQYKSDLKNYSGRSNMQFLMDVQNGKKGTLKYRPSTTYRWEETEFVGGDGERNPSCGMTLMTLGGLCAVLHSMSIQRIFLLGDSMMQQQANSLWKLLDQDGEPARDNAEPNFRHVISCPGGGASSSTEFTLEYVRSDELKENDQPVSVEKKIKNCGDRGGYCYPWKDPYLSDPARTLAICNTGAHYHDLTDFQTAFDRFLMDVDDVTHQRSTQNDVWLFRTNVPGHSGCEKKGITPFKDYRQYKEKTVNAVDRYDWNKFVEYNDYVVRALDARKNHHGSGSDSAVGGGDGGSPSMADIEALDVFPMTVLRQDGHAGDEFRASNLPHRDCLHYSLPGPVDWWNHLLFSNLQDM